ncbi:hypothetical protein D9M70_619550 [compost metagenome]
MDRYGLDFGQFCDRAGVEFSDDGAQLLLLPFVQRASARQDIVAGQVDKPLHLNSDAVPVEGGLGKVVNEGSYGGLVAAVQRAERDMFRGGGEGQASGRRTGISCGGSFRHALILS